MPLSVPPGHDYNAKLAPPGVHLGPSISDKSPSENSNSGDYMTQEQRKAFADFQLFEPNCCRHGSTVYGMSSAQSDVDLCVPSLQILDVQFAKFRNGEGPFTVEDDQLDCSLARIVLRHTNGAILDIVGMKYYSKVKDAVMSRICQEPTLRELFLMIRAWRKTWASDMTPQYGFPNTFNLQLAAIYLLQLMNVLPSWATIPQSAKFPSVSQHTAAGLYAMFLNFLNCDVYQCRMDLHLGRWNPKQRNGQQMQRWLLFDPVDRKRDVFSRFDPRRIQRVKYGFLGPELLKHEAYLRAQGYG
jgi:hypothetical protein